MNTEDVAQRAYRIWEMAGHPDDKDVEHWLQAEGELAEAITQVPSVEVNQPAQPRKRQLARKSTGPTARRPNRQVKGRI